MIFVNLEHNTPKHKTIYHVVIRTVFSDKSRGAYAKWTDNGFILINTLLFSDDYIYGFYEE